MIMKPLNGLAFYIIKGLFLFIVHFRLHFGESFSSTSDALLVKNFFMTFFVSFKEFDFDPAVL